MDNFTSIQKEVKKFYYAYATAQVVKEEFARLVSQSTGQNACWLKTISTDKPIIQYFVFPGALHATQSIPFYLHGPLPPLHLPMAAGRPETPF
jgi:hypothetical protein